MNNPNNINKETIIFLLMVLFGLGTVISGYLFIWKLTLFWFKLTVSFGLPFWLFYSLFSQMQKEK